MKTRSRRMSSVMCRKKKVQQQGAYVGAIHVGIGHDDDLAVAQEDGLVAPVAALFSRSTGRFALHQEQLATLGVAFLTVRQLVRHAAGFQRALAAGEGAGPAARFGGVGPAKG